MISFCEICELKFALPLVTAEYPWLQNAMKAQYVGEIVRPKAEAVLTSQ